MCYYLWLLKLVTVWQNNNSFSSVIIDYVVVVVIIDVSFCCVCVCVWATDNTLATSEVSRLFPSRQFISFNTGWHVVWCYRLRRLLLGRSILYFAYLSSYSSHHFIFSVLNRFNSSIAFSYCIICLIYSSIICPWFIWMTVRSLILLDFKSHAT